MNKSRVLFNTGLASLPVALLFLIQTIRSLYGTPHYEVKMVSGKVVEIIHTPQVSTLTILAACVAVILSGAFLYAGKRHATLSQ